MAMRQHLDLVHRGVDAIEQWRKENYDAPLDLTGAQIANVQLAGCRLSRVDLSDADLAKADLTEADLSQVDFSRANLEGAILRKANLHEADLTRANLRRADLKGAFIVRADLVMAYLGHADLTSANLRMATFGGAIFESTTLSEADFGLSTIWKATLANLDLSATKNLEQVIHKGPSTIGVYTLVRSKGKIPDSFLRGCGIPDAGSLSGESASNVAKPTATETINLQRAIRSRYHSSSSNRRSVQSLSCMQRPVRVG